MRRRGQSWSVDVVLAIVVFGFISIAFTSFALLQKPDVEKLQQNAQRVVLELETPVGGCGAILENDTINNESLSCLYGLDYDQFKAINNLRSDFCVYIEDEHGQIIQLNGLNGWGSNDLQLSGAQCGT